MGAEWWATFIGIRTASGNNLVGKVTKLLPIQDSNVQKRLNSESAQYKLEFIADKSDREIIRDFMKEDADILLTSDDDILRNKANLVHLGVKVMRPHKWINEFLKNIRGEEDGVEWVERTLFTIGS